MKTITAAFVSLTLSLSAGEKMAILKLADGTELRQVEIISMVEHGVKVTHKDGVGTVPPSKLPPDLAKRHDAYIATLLKEREAKRGTPHVTDPKPVAGAPPLSVKCPAVKETGHGFFEGGPFRYFVTFHNNSANEVTGRLVVSTENGEGVVNRGEAFDVTILSGGARTGFFNMLTAPPIRHGDAGVIKLKWIFTDSAGKVISGDCPVPNEIKDN